MSRPPVLTALSCKLVRDQLLTLCGNTSRRLFNRQSTAARDCATRTFTSSDRTAAVFDVESIRVDVELQKCTALRPGEAAKVGYVMGSSFSCLPRNIEGHIDQDHVLDGQRGFPLLRNGSEVFNRSRPLKPGESLGIFFSPVEVPSRGCSSSRASTAGKGRRDVYATPGPNAVRPTR